MTPVGGEGGHARMRAVVCHAHGPPESLLVESVPRPEPGDGEVLVRVGAAAVNFPTS